MFPRGGFRGRRRPGRPGLPSPGARPGLPGSLVPGRGRALGPRAPACVPVSPRARPPPPRGARPAPGTTVDVRLGPGSAVAAVGL